MYRWSLKIKTDYPLIRFHLVKSADNLADFLTRNNYFDNKGVQRLNLKNVNILPLDPVLDKSTFSVDEWQDFVNSHPEFLLDCTHENIPLLKENQVHVHAITDSTQLILKILNPLEILKDKFSLANIIRLQRREYDYIYLDLFNKPEKKREYQIYEKKYLCIFENDLIYVIKKDLKQILIPTDLFGPILFFHHLQNHNGINRMINSLQGYFIPNKLDLIKKLLSSCFVCHTENVNPWEKRYGKFICPDRGMQIIYVDLIEDLNPSSNYRHILCVICPLTKFVCVFPLK